MGGDIMFLFSYLVGSQIWLNLPVDGHHTWAKSQKWTKTTLQSPGHWERSLIKLLAHHCPLDASIKFPICISSLSLCGTGVQY
jgi:hypothetical protein